MDNLTDTNKENLPETSEEISATENIAVDGSGLLPDNSGTNCYDDKDGAGEMVVKKDLFCSHCGKQIENSVLFCPYCGKERNSTQQMVYCRSCGEKLNAELKYCPKCGAKSTSALVDIGLIENVSKVKGGAKKIKKPLVAILVCVIALAAVVATAISVVPKLFVSQEELLAYGKYAQAYKRASKEEKQDVLIENLLAVTCGDATKKLKDPSSFFLREAYYTPEHIVLCLSATNGFGGKTVSYCYYSFDKDTQTYSLFANETDLDDDVDISRYDSKERATEKIFDYVIKAAIKSIIKIEENKVSEQTVERINGLFKSGQLQNIELLEEAQTLYPTEEESTT